MIKILDGGGNTNKTSSSHSMSMSPDIEKGENSLSLEAEPTALFQLSSSAPSRQSPTTNSSDLQIDLSSKDNHHNRQAKVETMMMMAIGGLDDLSS